MRIRHLRCAAPVLTLLVSASVAGAAPLSDLAVDVPPVEGEDEKDARPAEPPPQKPGAPRTDGAPEASPKRPPDEDDIVELDKVVVEAPDEDYFKLGGSALAVDEEQLEQFEYDNVQKIMLSVPGVYVRGEDGYGLRPNIGIRGANSDRSKKVALMEDGVLFGPAPYAAPAAYYFPLVTRMTQVDVIKGPASIKYGPNTIGGAVNFQTRAIPADGLAGGVDVAGGSYYYGKGHGHVGYGSKYWGVLGEGVHLRTDGFKELDGGGNTGFVKNDFMLKGRINTNPKAPVYNELQVKLGYATESSNETYLGITDDDFRANPLRRYRASELDHMGWYRTQVEVQHKLDIGDVHLTTTAYHHIFDRTWRKFSSLADTAGQPIEAWDVLRNPTTARNRVYYDVLTGADTTEQDITLRIGANGRKFVAEGIQTVGTFETRGWLSHKVEYGARYHYDEIVRKHTEDGYFMRDTGVTSDGTPQVTTTHNKGSAHAVALHAMDDMTWKQLTVSPGMRVELIQTSLQSLPLGDGNPVAPIITANQHAFMPGVGLFYAFTDAFGALAGVHRGFSPVAPGQTSDVQPETSINYETGARYLDDRTHVEIIGFFNDYGNIAPSCGASEGCSAVNGGRQFAGGEADVYGLETFLSTEVPVNADLAIPVRASYTLTKTRVRTGFTSGDPQFATVQPGDELPYVPMHQAQLQSGAKGEMWDVQASGSFVSPMREEAGQGPLTGDQTETDASFIVDLSAQWEFVQHFKVYGKIINVANSAFIASRRPFGARPLPPRIFQLGLKWDF